MIDTTVVMITGHQPCRFPFAQMAVYSFLQQTYDNARMLIVNQGKSLSLNSPRVSELMIKREASTTLGDLRQYAMDRVETPYLCWWDDDDW